MMHLTYVKLPLDRRTYGCTL